MFQHSQEPKDPPKKDKEEDSFMDWLVEKAEQERQQTGQTPPPIEHFNEVMETGDPTYGAHLKEKEAEWGRDN